MTNSLSDNHKCKNKRFFSTGNDTKKKESERIRERVHRSRLTWTGAAQRSLEFQKRKGITLRANGSDMLYDRYVTIKYYDSYENL